MDNEALKANDNFNKQRRNIILFSLIVLFYEVGNLEVSGFNIISVKGTFDPSIVNPFLHGILLYFMWRYMVAFKDIGIMHSNIKDYRKAVYSNAYKKAPKVFLKKNGIKEKLKHLNLRTNIESSITKDVVARYGAEYRVTCTSNLDDTKKYEEEVISITGMALFIVKIRTSLSLFFTTNLFLEFYFPFMLFTFAIIESWDWHITQPFLFLLNW